MTTETISNVTVTTKASIYFDGKCISHGITLADGTRIKFLASEQARQITDEVLHVSGGHCSG